MKRLQCIDGLIFLCLVTFSHVSGQLTNPPAHSIPHFQFVTMDDRPFTDLDLPSGKLIFIMYFDPDCDHCQHAIKYIGDQYETFKKTMIYLVSMDDQKKTNHFMDTYGSELKGKKNVTVLMDKLQQFIVRFNPVRPPSMFLFSSQRKLLDYEDNAESVFRLVNTIKKNVK